MKIQKKYHHSPAFKPSILYIYNPGIQVIDSRKAHAKSVSQNPILISYISARSLPLSLSHVNKNQNTAVAASREYYYIYTDARTVCIP